MKKNNPINKSLSEKPKRITLATIKSFIRKNKENLFIRTTRSYDLIESFSKTSDNLNFRPIESTDLSIQYTLGIKDVWIAGQGRDGFLAYENDKYIGYDIYNVCHAFNLVIKKPK
jgi:hypothetical protein